MNFFLKSRQEIDQCTKYLKDNGFISSGLSCKDWEIAQVLPYLTDGNLIDLGSDGSVVLENALKKNIVGMKVGIDLAYPDDVVSPEGINLLKGDLMNTGLPDGIFNFITCLSTIEHEIDLNKFIEETSRLLVKEGQLFVSFDYSPTKIDTSLTRLYSLSWTILCKNDVEELIDICREEGLVISGEVDWTVKDMVINPQYCSPANCEYTFGIFHFIKK